MASHRTRQSRAARAARRNRRPTAPSFETLEARLLLAVTSFFDSNGLLAVSSDGGDSISISAVSGQVKINGGNPTSGAVSASAVKSILVHGGPGHNTISLAGVTSGAFTGLTNGATVFGNAGADTMTGGDTAELFDGGDGNDVIDTGSGNDTLIGGAGQDCLRGGAGIDRLIASGSALVLTSTSLTGQGTDTISSIAEAELIGTAGNDSLQARTFGGSVTLDGGDGDDTLEGSTRSDWVIGGAGSDLMVGRNPNNTITFVDLNNRIFSIRTQSPVTLTTDSISGIERASITGGSGLDIISARDFTLGPVTLDGAAGGGFLTGTDHDDLFINGYVRETGDSWLATDSQLIGRGTDGLSKVTRLELNGGPGDDRLDASAFNGNVVLSGADGNDTLLSSRSSVQDCLMGGAGIDRIIESGSNLELDDWSINVDFLFDIEEAHLIGTSGNDRLDATNFTRGSVTIEGFEGNDTLLGGSHSDRISAGPGVDSMVGNGGDDTLGGGSGSGTVDGGGGDDLYTASGVSLFRSDAAGVFFASGAGLFSNLEAASISGTDGGDLLDGSGFPGRLTLEGLAGDDTLIGSARDDLLKGGDGLDLMRGQRGDDTLTGGLGDDGIDGGEDLDTVVEVGGSFTLSDSTISGNGTDQLLSIERGSLGGGESDDVIDASAFAGAVTLLGAAGNDSLIGGPSGDSLSGGDGNDTLNGGGGDDTLDGEAGDDALFGGEGKDSLNGGAGNDSLDFGTEPLVPPTPTGTLLVNSALDNTTSDDGLVTLREAILAANTGATTDLGQAGTPAGLDSIIFEEFLRGSTIVLTLGEMAITDDVTVLGLGAPELTIDAAGGSRIFNIVSLTATLIDVEVRGLTLTGGSGGPSRAGLGGAIFSRSNLTLADMVITGNSATSLDPFAFFISGGGGLFHQEGSLAVLNSTVSGNRTNGFAGGIVAISAFGPSSIDFEVVLEDSTITDNAGGGLYIGVVGDFDEFEDDTDGVISIRNTEISGNTAAEQGIFSLPGTGVTIVPNSSNGAPPEVEVSISDSTISSNAFHGLHIQSQGGGRATLKLTDTHVEQNGRGGMFFEGSSGLYSASLERSSVSNNTSTGVSWPGSVSISQSTISGNRAGGLTIGGGVIASSTISGNSKAAGGAGIDLGAGTLSVIDSTIADNRASSGSGGALFMRFSTNTVTISGSTISGNSANTHGGGIRMEAGSLTVTNSTISGNRASGGSGGGVSIGNGTAEFRNTTIARNWAHTEGGGGGIHETGPNPILRSTIVADNMAGAGAGFPNDLSSGAVVSAEYSLIQAASAFAIQHLTPDSNILGQDPRLAALGDYGGSTRTHFLRPDSPAMEKGSNPSGLSSDQRGEGFVRTFGAAADIGAFEYQGEEPPPVPQGGIIRVNSAGSDTTPGNGLVTLREALDAANNNTTTDLGDSGSGEATDTIIFDESLRGATITDSALRITGDSIIQGLGASELTIDGGLLANTRIFTISDGSPSTLNHVELRGLTLTGGRSIGTSTTDLGNGGATFSSEDLTLSEVIITGNTAGGFGGGVFQIGGALTIIDSYISANTTGFSGGGIAAGPLSAPTGLEQQPAIVRIHNSTINGNDAVTGVGDGAYIVFTADAANPATEVIDGDLLIFGSDISGNLGDGLALAVNFVSGLRPVGNVAIAGSRLSNNASEGFITILNGSGAGQVPVSVTDSELNGNAVGLAISCVSATVSNSIINNNRAGVIASLAGLTIDSSTVSGNTAGSGILVDSATSLVLRESTVSDNRLTSGPGGGLRMGAGNPTAVIDRSTISGNTASTDGGGIQMETGSLTVVNSTISGNRASGGMGGGVNIRGGTSVFLNTTIASNSANTSLGGGGIAESGSTDPILRSTIVADNTAAGVANDLNSSSAFRAEFSLIEAITATTTIHPLTPGTNLIGVEPRLVALAHNGGPTLTHALQLDSPAIDAGSNPSGLLFDQRGPGFRRTRGVATDMGALEQNRPPVVGDNAARTDEDTPVMIDVLANDTDADGDTLTPVVVSGPSRGTLSVNADGSITYAPDANFNGAESFTYLAHDGLTGSNIATVTIEIAAVNDVPVTSNDLAQVDEDNAILIRVLDNDSDADGDALTAVLLAHPEHGTLTVNGDGSFTYTPTAHFHGTDAFTYQATDGAVFSNVALVCITVASINDAPVAASGADQELWDNDGDTVELVTLDATGSFDIDGLIVSYSWAEGETVLGSGQVLEVSLGAGVHTITLTVTDDGGASATDTVTVEVIRPVVSLSGLVFDDVNDDGLFDPAGGDAGIGGVLVELINKASGKAVAIALTTDDGTYVLSTATPPGLYTIAAARLAGFLDGDETAGSLGGSVDNSRDSETIAAIPVSFNNADLSGGGYDFAEIRPSQLLGVVWQDFNNDGIVNFGERPIGGAGVTLIGTDDRGNPVSAASFSDSDGVYAFFGLRPGTYHLTEQDQSAAPLGAFDDGVDVLGEVGSIRVGDANEADPRLSAHNDVFVNVALSRPGSVGQNYNFGERPHSLADVTAGQTAMIGFWQNGDGQALIRSLNGGADSTQLGDWLAATLPNMYGAAAGANDLTGRTNAQVADFLSALFRRTKQQANAAGLTGPVKLDVQVLATALAVYVTNENLAGPVAASYGFTVTADGVGVHTFDVGENGAAFGVANGSRVSILDLLLAVDARSSGGVLYDLNGDGDTGDENETLFRTMAHDLLSALNQAGSI